MASVCSCRNHDRKFYFEKHFAFGFSYFTMTVFAIFTYTEFFKHKSAEGEKMNKKTTGIIAYITAGSLRFAQVIKRALSFI